MPCACGAAPFGAPVLSTGGGGETGSGSFGAAAAAALLT